MKANIEAHIKNLEIEKQKLRDKEDSKLKSSGLKGQSNSQIDLKNSFF